MFFDSLLRRWRRAHFTRERLAKLTADLQLRPVSTHRRRVLTSHPLSRQLALSCQAAADLNLRKCSRGQSPPAPCPAPERSRGKRAGNPPLQIYPFNCDPPGADRHDYAAETDHADSIGRPPANSKRYDRRRWQAWASTGPLIAGLAVILICKFQPLPRRHPSTNLTTDSQRALAAATFAWSNLGPSK